MPTDTTTDIAALTAHLTAALARKRQSRDTLADAIVALCEPLPRGARVRLADGREVTIARVYAGCSQWSNPGRVDVVAHELGVYIGAALVAEVSPSHWDGNNNHTKNTGLFSDRDLSTPAKLAPAAVLREVAAMLPAALAAYAASALADADASIAATAAVRA